MFPAFLCTGPTHLRTQSTKLFGQFTITAHQYRSQRAYICAVPIKLNAASHRFHVFLTQTRGSAHFACLSTCPTCLDTGLIHGISHCVLRNRCSIVKHSCLRAPSRVAHMKYDRHELTPFRRSSLQFCKEHNPSLLFQKYLGAFCSDGWPNPDL